MSRRQDMLRRLDEDIRDHLERETLENLENGSLQSCSSGSVDSASARMIAGRSVKSIALAYLLACSTSCVGHLYRHFQVLPSNPNYVLRSPDSRRTPFPEILKTYNGFEPGNAWIDLEPLMELRIENAFYEPGVPRTGLIGFLGTEIARYAVTSNDLRLLSVQPMKNRPNAEASIEDLLSSSKTKFSRYRLYYEIVFSQRHHSHGSVLLGADSQREIDALSTQLTHPETVCYARSAHCVVFPEACSVSVEMKILVNGKAQSVVWGSTLERVVQQVHHLQMKRLYAGHPRSVRVNGSDSKALLLPLLPGDEMSFRARN